MTEPSNTSENPWTKAIIVPHDTSNISQCCVATVDHLSEHNPMMVCNHCKKLIKIFTEEGAFKNYVKFCYSQRREIETAKYGTYWVVTFMQFN